MVALNQLADCGVTVIDYASGQAIDLDSFEGRLTTTLKAEFSEEFRQAIRRHTRDAMRRKAEQGYVTGSKVFGYDNHRLAVGQVERVINPTEAQIVRDMYTRYSEGHGVRSIAEHLNRSGVPSPRAQQGRPSGWSASTVKAVLERPLYRGQILYGRTAKAYGRELGKTKGTREKGMIDVPADRWIRRDNPSLRIIDADLAARCDARRTEKHRRLPRKGGHVPERASGKYLLSGGLLVCPTCGGHFEARIAPWKGSSHVYISSTRRRKPGKCTNTLALPMRETEDAILSLVEGEILGSGMIEELLALVDTAPDPSTRLMDERNRLTGEIDNLVTSIAKGMDAAIIAPVVKAHQQAIATIDVQLRTPRPVRPNLETLRQALAQRTAQWQADLRAEPRVARLVLRRLVGPLTLWEETEDGLRWDAPITPETLLDGLVQLVASPSGTDASQCLPIRGISDLAA
jgi:hypothetical protein